MKPDLPAIRARCDAATPGPRQVDGSVYDEDCNEHLAPYGLEGPNERLIWSSGGGEYAHPDMATAQFIAHARTDIPALLAYVEELEGRVTYTVGETEWAHRIANAEQKEEEAREERDEAECENVKLREEFLRLRVETGRHRRAAALSEERALTAEERLERVTHERDQERKVFEQAMSEAQTDVMELRARITELEKR